MADSILFGIAQQIIENIASAAVQQIGSNWGATKELSGLEETISKIKTVILDAEEEKNHNHQVRNWLQKLDDVVYEADDLMDDVFTEALRQQLMSGSDMGKKVRIFFSSSNQIVFGRIMAYKIKDINDRLAAIYGNNFHLEMHKEEDIRDPQSCIRGEIVIGREKNRNDILPTLKLRYDNLPLHLKYCFAYCSLFPKDYEIDVDVLIKLWMAQGFIKSSDLRPSLEDAGIDIFKELEQRSFFQEVKENDFGDIISCKMHGLMHDLAVQVAGMECATLHSVGENIGGRTRHVSFEFDLDPSGRFPTFLSKENRMRTILFLQQSGNSNMLSWDVIPLGLKALRTLDFHKSGLEKVPNSIGKLKHLRYLDLSGNGDIKTLPNSITKLQNLQTLKLSDCRALIELPRDLKKLVNLRHLENGGCNRLTHMPRGLGQLSNPVILKEFVVNEVGVGPTNKQHNQGQVGVGELNELMELNNLRGELHIRKLRYGKDASEEYKNAKLKEKQHLHALRLSWSNGSNDNDDSVDTTSQAEDYEITLESLEPHPKLKELHIFGYRIGVGLAHWFFSLTTLDRLVLEECEKIKNVSPLGQLPRLKSLRLVKLCSLEYISNGNVTSEPLLSTLQSFELDNLPNLKGWWKYVGEEEEEEEDIPPFKCLFQLIIRDCPKLTSNMPLYPYLKGELKLTDNYSLKTFQRTQQMKMKMMDSLSNLTSLYIIGIKSLQSLSAVLTCSLTSLRKLSMEKCPRLKALSPAIQHLTSLQELDIISCSEVDIYGDGGHMWQALQSLLILRLQVLPQLRTLPDELQQLTSLQQLILHDCKSLVRIPEWIGNLKSLLGLCISGCNKLTSLCIPSGMHQLTSLQSLEIRDLPQLGTLPDGLQQLTSLQKLKLYACESLAIPEWIGNLKSLRELGIGGPNKLTSLPETMRQLTSLQSLNIEDLLQLETLPEVLQKLTSLQKLKLYAFESLVTIPEWIGNLKSLRELDIRGCSKLTSLPEGMSQLTSLQRLDIRDCDPILKQRCEREAGEDWHKVSHIRRLYIHTERISPPQRPSTSSSAPDKIFKSFSRLRLCNKWECL